LPPAGFHDIVTHMKTTIDIADSVLSAAKKEAERRGTTLREVVESGLRLVLAESREKGRRGFTLRKHPFRGEGLQPGIREGDWAGIRGTIYEGRGA
jgi:hypothetical protein